MLANVVFWLAAAVCLATAEAAFPALVTLWFAIGALGAGIACALGAGVLLQVLVFIVVSVAGLALMRPLLCPQAGKDGLAKGASPEPDVIGRCGRVSRWLDGAARGCVRLEDGMSWTARCQDGRRLAEGTPVVVVARESTTLVVEAAAEGHDDRDGELRPSSDARTVPEVQESRQDFRPTGTVGEHEDAGAGEVPGDECFVPGI